MGTLIAGAGFEARMQLGVIWARVWWEMAEDQPSFARPLLNAVGEHMQAGTCTSLVLDLREAPPVAHFGARLRLGAVLAAAEENLTPVHVLVGPTEIQARDLYKLVRDRAPTMGSVSAASSLAELARAPTEASGAAFRQLAA